MCPLKKEEKMVNTIEGSLIAKGKKFAIVASRFNDFITKELISGCIDVLQRHGVEEKDLVVAWVPGAFEIPVVAQKLAKTKDYDALICLGTVIRGVTPHFDYIASEVARGIAKVSHDAGLPVIFGVLLQIPLNRRLSVRAPKTVIKEGMLLFQRLKWLICSQS